MSREIGREIGRRIKNGGDLSSLVFVHLAQNEAFDEPTLAEHADTFASWQAGVTYAVRDIVQHGGALWKCVQAHSAQSGWAPSEAASLWGKIGLSAEEWPEWSQPIGAHDAYQTGDKVSLGGRRWISAADNNVWQPGVYGWREA